MAPRLKTIDLGQQKSLILARFLHFTIAFDDPNVFWRIFSQLNMEVIRGKPNFVGGLKIWQLIRLAAPIEGSIYNERQKY